MMHYYTLSSSTHLSLLNLILTVVIFSRQCLGQIDKLTNPDSLLATPTVHKNDSILVSNQQQSLLSNNIDVWIEATPIKEQAGVTYVAANTPIQIEAKFYSDTNDSAIEFKWSTKDGPMETSKKAIVHTFTKSDEDNFIQVDVYDPKTNSTGQHKLDITVKSRLVVSDPVGKTFLEKGELLEISLVYSGSPPFKYCYKFCSDYDILPCNLCFPRTETINTTIPIVHYLHYVGNYTLMFQIENIMNYEERHYVIKINDSVRPKSNLPIAPIVSSIMAVCILISGVALHIKFKDSSYITETANFDFFHDDDEEAWEQELSLIQRVRYLFCGLDDQDEDNETRYLIQKGATNMTSTYSNGIQH